LWAEKYETVAEDVDFELTEAYVKLRLTREEIKREQRRCVEDCGKPLK
jgi:hypothetical protein